MEINHALLLKRLPVSAGSWFEKFRSKHLEFSFVFWKLKCIRGQSKFNNRNAIQLKSSKARNSPP